ncbi:MAG: hypothetical protein SWH61_02800 [Thermodesulfobacteriota bacterium]|nr:hypothetical protein [Thermodesulfobacteriota bacterium]
MKKKRELSSTDRLLGKITNRSASPSRSLTDDTAAADSFSTEAGRSRAPRNKSLFSLSPKLHSHHAHPGVIIDKEGIVLVHPGTGMDDTAFVSGVSDTPFIEPTDIFDESFEKQLSKLLSEISNTNENHAWCALPDHLVDIRYLKIPRAKDKDLENAIFWSYKKEVVAEEKDIIFDYEVIGEFTERGVAKIGVTACSIHKDVAARLNDLFTKAGCRLDGITTSAFAIQTLLRNETLVPGHENICCVHVGRESSSISIFVENNLMLVRQIRAGLSSLAEAIISESERESLQLEGDISRDAVQSAMETIIEHVRYQGKTADPLSDSLFIQIAPAVDRIGRQIERTLDYFRQNIYSERISAVLIHGEVAEYRPLLDTIAEHLGIPVYSPPDILAPAMTFVHTDLVKQSPHFLPGLGLIQASNELTPNIIFTHKEKKAYKKITFVNRGILAATAALFTLCVLIFSWQLTILSGLDDEKNALATSLAALPADVNPSSIQELADAIIQKKTRLKEKAVIMEARGLLNELMTHTPDAIKLDTLELTMKNGRGIILNGYVFGSTYSQDAILAGYVMDLVQSPLFSKVTVKRQKRERIDNRDILQFSATIDI